jgi:hypothetical protein
MEMEKQKKDKDKNKNEEEEILHINKFHILSSFRERERER